MFDVDVNSFNRKIGNLCEIQTKKNYTFTCFLDFFVKNVLLLKNIAQLPENMVSGYSYCYKTPTHHL